MDFTTGDKMIYIKTQLRKMPESCKECRFSKVIDTKEYDDWRRYKRVCEINGRKCVKVKAKNGNKKFIRSKWCPLIEINESEKEELY